ncbi:hypothetical protein R1sor_017320 [Riccia sorocarpa]|uniref:Regulatory protein zeste n=1 Tax=Riccia sorocarpa TaxID=122646 RepID=A0ABD3I6H2_9MARC
MEARQFSAERGNTSSEGAEPLSPSFIPCSSPSNDSANVYPWSHILNSQPVQQFTERPIPLRHPYLQPSFALGSGVGIGAVRTPAPLFGIPILASNVSIPAVNIPAPVSVVSTHVVGAVPDGTENVSGLRSRQRTSGIFTWDHQAILFLIEAKRLEWEEFEATTGRRGVMITALEKWRKVQERLASNGVVADVSQIRSKWERLAADCKKVGDWNKQSGNEHYSSLSAQDRRDNKLPPNFNEELFETMDVSMHRRHSVTGGGVSESGNSGSDSGVQTQISLGTRLGESLGEDPGAVAPLLSNDFSGPSYPHSTDQSQTFVLRPGARVVIHFHWPRSRRQAPLGFKSV